MRQCYAMTWSGISVKYCGHLAVLKTGRVYLDARAAHYSYTWRCARFGGRSCHAVWVSFSVLSLMIDDSTSPKIVGCLHGSNVCSLANIAPIHILTLEMCASRLYAAIHSNFVPFNFHT